MKTTIDKVQNGLAAYIDNEFLNHLEGWRKVIFGAGAGLIIKNLDNTINVYKETPLIKMLGIFDEENQIDIDAIHDALIDHFTTEGEYIDVPKVGRVKVTKNDIENLYKYIKEA